jgi:hypothetical protein
MLIFLVNLSEEERKKEKLLYIKKKNSEAPYVIDVAVIF